MLGQFGTLSSWPVNVLVLQCEAGILDTLYLRVWFWGGGFVFKVIFTTDEVEDVVTVGWCRGA